MTASSVLYSFVGLQYAGTVVVIYILLFRIYRNPLRRLSTLHIQCADAFGNGIRLFPSTDPRRRNFTSRARLRLHTVIWSRRDSADTRVMQYDTSTEHTQSPDRRYRAGAVIRVAEPENLKTVPVPTFYLNTVPVPGHIHAYTYTYTYTYMCISS